MLRHLTLIVVLLNGCVPLYSMDRATLVHPDPKANVAADQYQCEQEAAQFMSQRYGVRYSGDSGYSAAYASRVEQCMLAKGWQYHVPDTGPEAPCYKDNGQRCGTVDPNFVLPDCLGADKNKPICNRR